MRMLAIELDEAVLENAERKARELETSVSDVVANYLRTWAEANEPLEEARRQLKARFARRDWQFAVGAPDTREQRNARR